MVNHNMLELVNKDKDYDLIGNTPIEETLIRIKQMRVESMRAENGKIRVKTLLALLYVVKYLRTGLGFSVQQVRALSTEDLNRMPDLIFAERERKVLLLGWIPIFGWIFASQYS